jgi:hypothetical protein
LPLSLYHQAFDSKPRALHFRQNAAQQLEMDNALRKRIGCDLRVMLGVGLDAGQHRISVVLPAADQDREDSSGDGAEFEDCGAEV